MTTLALAMNPPSQSTPEVAPRALPTRAYAAQSSTSGLAPFQFERRVPGPHDVLIEIQYCGVCHTDIHFVRNDWGISIYPMVPGHEIVGKVRAVGSQVQRHQPGDTVGVGCLVDSCRGCDQCNRGLQQYCSNGMVLTYSAYEKDGKTVTFGGYSNQIVVNEDFVLRISEKLSLERVAPLLCAGITTYSPLRHWKVGTGHKVGVVGLGGLGHMAVKFAASFGAEVTVLSTSPHKEADARALGAHHFLLTTNEEQAKTRMSYFDFIMDTVSSRHDYNLPVSMLKTDGTLICVGAPPEPIELQAFPLLFQRRRVVGSLIGGLPETQEMLDYCAAKNITADIEMIAMKDIHQAYERMEKSDVKYRFVIDMATL
jgi:alcohol dehydrogenase (NADP+)